MKSAEELRDFKRFKPQIVITIGHLINRGVNTRPEIVKKAKEIYSQGTIYDYLDRMEERGLISRKAQAGDIRYRFHPQLAIERDYDLTTALEDVKERMEQDDSIDNQEIDERLREIVERNQDLVKEMERTEEDWKMIQQKLEELGLDEGMDAQKVSEFFTWLKENKNGDRFRHINVPEEAIEESERVEGAVPSLLREFLKIYTGLYADQPTSQIGLDFMVSPSQGMPDYQKLLEE